MPVLECMHICMHACMYAYVDMYVCSTYGYRYEHLVRKCIQIIAANNYLHTYIHYIHTVDRTFGRNNIPTMSTRAALDL